MIHKKQLVVLRNFSAIGALLLGFTLYLIILNIDDVNPNTTIVGATFMIIFYITMIESNKLYKETIQNN